MGVGAELAAKGWVCHSNVLSPPPHVRKGPMSKEPAPGLSCKPLVHDTALPPPQLRTGRADNRAGHINNSRSLG